MGARKFVLRAALVPRQATVYASLRGVMKRLATLAMSTREVIVSTGKQNGDTTCLELRSFPVTNKLILPLPTGDVGVSDRLRANQKSSDVTSSA